MLLLKGGEEDGFAFEPGALRDALDGGGQMSPCTQQEDGMRHTQFISITGKGGIQLLVEAVGHTDTGDVECLRNVGCVCDGLALEPGFFL